LFVVALFQAVDPSPAQGNVQRFRVGDRLFARRLLVDTDPEFFRARVIDGDPLLERSGGAEGLDGLRIDDDGRHYFARRAWLAPRSGVALGAAAGAIPLALS